MKQLILMIAAAVCLFAASGCTTYYRVTDPVSGRTYYTKSIDNKGGGSIRFEDAATGGEVTLQNSSVQEINQQEYDSNRAASGKKM